MIAWEDIKSFIPDDMEDWDEKGIPHGTHPYFVWPSKEATENLEWYINESKRLGIGFGLKKEKEMEFDKVSFDVYSYLANNTAVNQGFGKDLNHFGFGLVAEAGEVANILQKYHRGDSRYYSFEDDLDEDGDLLSFTKEAREMMKKELGDVLWHIAALADIFEIPLSEVAQTNLDKLADRGRRKIIQGDGDNR